MSSASPLPPPPPPLPPPAPPPPPVATYPSKPERGGTVLDSVNPTHYMAVGQLGVYEYRQQCDREKKSSNTGNIIFLSHYKTVVPIIQNGPLCGLVAMAMAAPLVHAEEMTTEKLLEQATQKGYTKQGEMFSAANMCCLLQSVLKSPYSCEVVKHCEESQFLQYLLQGDLLLIPYDADKNHSPCRKKGHKAHWLLVTGCFLAVDNTGNIIDKSQLEEKEDYYEKNLFHLKPGDNMTPGILKTLRQNTDKVLGVFVYGQQGKSKHTQASTISELLASNAQLVELGPDRATDDYVVPEGGLQQGLCGQIVRITDPDV